MVNRRYCRWAGTICLTVYLLSAGFAAPAGAAEPELKKGWQQQNEEWVYLDSSGVRVCNTWIREKDGSYYYLGEDGCMAVNTIIRDGDDIYYTDENGVRVKNQWVSEPNDDKSCDQEVEILWYYFGDNGKAKNEEGKAVKIKEEGRTNKYFFDSDGHMLSGWQEITNKDGNQDIYYLGDQNEGYAHLLWQYLPPSEELLKDGSPGYDALEMFYFGYDGVMTRGKESKLEGHYFLFDENGVMGKGWYPGVTPTGEEFAVNKFYDEDTGARAVGWLYAYDQEDEAETGDPHWFYCDKKNGSIYNEGGKDCIDQVAAKNIDGHTYFFDSHGHMITGLISTGGADIKDNPFVLEEYCELSGDIGKTKGTRPAGIYYLSEKEGSLGQLQKDKALVLWDGKERYSYYLDPSGRAYTNAMVDGCVYDETGLKCHGDFGWDIITMESDIYKENDYLRGTPKDGAEPVIPAGSRIIVNASGKVKKAGRIELDGSTYIIENYLVQEP